MKYEKDIPIKLAFLHQAVVWPGNIGSERTLSNDRVKGIKMVYGPQGLIVTVKGEDAIIPLANVAIAIVDSKKISKVD